MTKPMISKENGRVGSHDFRNPLKALATQSPRARKEHRKKEKVYHESTIKSGKHFPSVANQQPDKLIDTGSIGIPPNASRPPETTNGRAATVASTDVSDLHYPSFFEAGESEFELMHVKVKVLGLTGIISERIEKKNAVNCSSRVQDPASRTKPTSVKDGAGSSICEQSTISTIGVSSQEANTICEKESTPTTAVLSYKRNVSNSQTTILSHLPSLPLGTPSSSFGYVDKYMASWPADTAIPLIHDEDKADQSTFTLLRVMMREPFHSGDTRASANVSTFAHETIDLHINLARGHELIPLGIVTLVISGDEEGHTTMAVPAKSVRVKKGKTLVMDASSKKIRRPKLFKKSRSRPWFPSDCTRTFHLDENATLRVSIHCIPHGTLKAAEASKARRAILMQREQERKTDENSIIESKSTRHARRQKQLHELAKMGPITPKSIPIPVKPSNTLSSTFGMYFCGSSLCASQVTDFGESSDNPDEVEKIKCSSQRKDYSVDGDTIDKFFKEQLGLSYASSSEVSSVSGSESSSESESDEDQNEGRHLNRKIIVAHRRRTFGN